MPRLPWWCEMLLPVSTWNVPPLVKWNAAPVRGSTKCRSPVAIWSPFQHGTLVPVATWQHGTSATPVQVARSNVTPVPMYPRLSWPHPWQSHSHGNAECCSCDNMERMLSCCLSVIVTPGIVTWNANPLMVTRRECWSRGLATYQTHAPVVINHIE